MNKQQAYNSFWRSFGVLAFEENTVPDDDTIQKLIDEGVAESKYPYITYQVVTGDIEDILTVTASIWDKNTSWERSDLLSNRISKYTKDMSIIRLDNGGMFINKGSPFSQHMSEEGDPSIRRIILNISVNFFTDY